jgi:hypothetical protein
LGCLLFIAICYSLTVFSLSKNDRLALNTASMPLIIRNKTDRATLQFAHAAALRTTSAVVEQLGQTPWRLPHLKLEVAELRYQLSQRDTAAALAAPSPSAAVH